MMRSSHFKNEPLVSKADIEFYGKNGYCTIEGMIGENECNQLLEEAARIAEKQEVKFLPMMNPHQVSPPLAALLRRKNIIQSLELIIQSKVWALQSMFYFKPPGQLGRDLHQDNFYVRTERGAYVGIWIALEDADRENGCLVVYPGSQREELLEVVENSSAKATNAGTFQNDRGHQCIVPDGYQKVYLETSKGSVVFMHNYTIHGSEANLSRDRFRRSFVAHYIKMGSSFRPGNHAKRHPIDVYGEGIL